MLLHERIAQFVEDASTFDLLGQRDFLVWAQQLVASDLVEIQLDGVRRLAQGLFRLGLDGGNTAAAVSHVYLFIQQCGSRLGAAALAFSLLRHASPETIPLAYTHAHLFGVPSRTGGPPAINGLPSQRQMWRQTTSGRGHLRSQLRHLAWTIIPPLQ